MDSRLMVALFFALDKKGGYDKMKITDYEKVRQLDESNIVLIDGNNGTKTILVSDFAKALIGLMNSKDFISGVNLSELDQIKTLSTNDKFLVGTAAGNKAIGANDALFAILDSFVPKEQRRMIYRGKNLGSVVTEEQKTNIKNGTFKGFFLGELNIQSFPCWCKAKNSSGIASAFPVVSITISAISPYVYSFIIEIGSSFVEQIGIIAL